MKKTVLAILMTVAATTAFAEGKCEGGNVFEGVIDGHEYCISKSKMNWWSAFTWCQRQGRHLASLKEVCEGWHGATGNTACGNLVKSGVTDKQCWTANPSGSTYAYFVNAGTGNINTHPNDPRNADHDYALCY
ncbi:MAG: hypothetical protein ACI4RJ_04015 [Alphaproteobacteria bacterium]